MISKIINIKKYKEAHYRLEMIGEKNYGNVDIKICNLELKKLNKLVKHILFKKNNAYVSAETLWEIMNKNTGKGKHHFHQLSVDDVIKGLVFLKEPICIIEGERNRILIISSFISSFNLPLLVVVEVNAGLIKNKNAYINKIITIFPKDDIDGFMAKYASNKMLYKK